MKLSALFKSKRSESEAVPAAVAQKRRQLIGRTVRSLAEMFKSASQKPLDQWTGTPVSADAFIARYLPTLVARSREQWSNNDYVRAFIRLVRQNVVGPKGITMQAKAKKPRGKLDKAANAAIEAEWESWGRKGGCDVTGTLSWCEIQRLATETAARDGEFIFRLVYGDDAGPHGFALQAIDPMRLPVWYENFANGDGGNFIRHGIEYNRFGRPVAYHFASTDEWSANYYLYAGRGFERVPADQIIHGYVREVVGQKRGIPWSSTSLFRLHHLQGFEDASVQNARAGAATMGFIEYDEGYGPEMDTDASVADTIDAEPLGFHELPEGARLKEFKPTYPSGEFAVFNKAMLRGAAAGWGVLYNNVAGDLEGVNFSSIRQGTLDEREHYKELQEWLIETLIQPVYDAWIKWKLLRGDIKVGGTPLPASRLEVYSAVSWQPRRWQWIDPQADVQAAVESIRAGLTSPSQVIREQGRDPETIFTEFAEDLQAMKDAGIPEDVIHLFLFGPKATQQAQQAQKKEQTQETA